MKSRLKGRTRVYLTSRQVRELKRRAFAQGISFDEQINKAVGFVLDLWELEDFLRYEFPKRLRHHASKKSR